MEIPIISMAEEIRRLCDRHEKVLEIKDLQLKFARDLIAIYKNQAQQSEIIISLLTQKNNTEVENGPA